MTEFKTAVAESLRKRMAPASVENADKVAFIASALDPKHKHLKRVNPLIRVAVRGKLSELCGSLAESSATNLQFSQLSDHDSAYKTTETARKRQSTQKEMASNTLSGKEHYSLETLERNEIENYFMEPCISPEQDQLIWWKKK